MTIDCTFFNFYGTFLILSIIIGITIYDIFLIKWKVRNIHIAVLNCLFLFLIVIGGIGLTIIENFIFYRKLVIGVASYGGLLGMISAIFIFTKFFKYNIHHFFKILFISVPLMYSISKIGCFLSGCCYGIEYEGLANVIYISSHMAPLNIPLFPIQLVESLTFLLIFIYLILLYKRKNNKIISISLILCGIAKYFLEFLRYSWQPIITFTQVISLLFILIGLYLFKRSGSLCQKI